MATLGVTVDHKATALKRSAYFKRVTEEHKAPGLRTSTVLERVTVDHIATALKRSTYFNRVTEDHWATDPKRSANFERSNMSNRSPKARKVILASLITLTITVYVITTIIACIFGSVEDRDGIYTEKLFNEVSFFQCTNRERDSRNPSKRRY